MAVQTTQERRQRAADPAQKRAGPVQPGAGDPRAAQVQRLAREQAAHKETEWALREKLNETTAALSGHEYTQLVAAQKTAETNFTVFLDSGGADVNDAKTLLK